MTDYSTSKFSDSICEQLYGLSMDGLSAEVGSVADGFGWFGCVEDTGIAEAPHAILTEDSQGFVDYMAHDTKELLLENWQMLEADYLEWYGPSE